jgi:tripartite ATP-independent transporter DctP family solute receptor
MDRSHQQAPNAPTTPARMTRRRALLAGAAALAMPALARAEPLRLRIGHALPVSHPVHPSMQHFADIVRERTGGAVEVAIFPDGQIGQELDLLAQARAGKLDLVKVSASALERLAPACRAFNLPFLMRDRAHWRRVMTGDVGADVLASAEPAGLIGLGYYDAGSRSFYGQRPIERPEDLKGLKIRIQPSPTMKRMMALFEADGVEMNWEQVFVALKSRLVDGAENSVAALIVGRHAEVVTWYSATEHTMVPDVFLMSAARWRMLSPSQQGVVREAALASYGRMNALWADFETTTRQQVEAMGVRFNAPEKAAFAARTAALTRDVADDAVLRDLVRRIEAA